MIAELLASMWREYVTLTGTITIRVVGATVKVAGRRFEVFLETPLYGGWRALAGRVFLDKLRLLLDGPSRRLCVLG